MLFPFPVEAIQDNWLHQAVTALIKTSMDDADAGSSAVAWPDCLPEDCRIRLKRFTQLRDKLMHLRSMYLAQTAEVRTSIRSAMEDQEALAELYEGCRAAVRADQFPDEVRSALTDFYRKAFAMLSPLGIRDANYKRFIESVAEPICPFCGCEYFAGAASKREPLDHYLAISLYPFAGANVRNLVPMGTRCNTSYKRAKDILRRDDGTRRKCFDPYAEHAVTIDLLGSKLFSRGAFPEWVVNIRGDEERVMTWDHIFETRRRWTYDHLDSVYKSCIRIFREVRSDPRSILPAGATVSETLGRLAQLNKVEGWSDRAFLKAAVFDLLQERCSQGGAEAARLTTEISHEVSTQ